jgi:hypothetical protein
MARLRPGERSRVDAARSCRGSPRWTRPRLRSGLHRQGRAGARGKWVRIGARPAGVAADTMAAPAPPSAPNSGPSDRSGRFALGDLPTVSTSAPPQHAALAPAGFCPLTRWVGVSRRHALAARRRGLRDAVPDSCSSAVPSSGISSGRPDRRRALRRRRGRRVDNGMAGDAGARPPCVCGAGSRPVAVREDLDPAHHGRGGKGAQLLSTARPVGRRRSWAPGEDVRLEVPGVTLSVAFGGAGCARAVPLLPDSGYQPDRATGGLCCARRHVETTPLGERPARRHAWQGRLWTALVHPECDLL